ncbi:MAG: lysophospholipase [Mycobacterium leprae]
MLYVSGRIDGHRVGELRAADGVTIHYREWRRDSPKATVLYLHGQGDHSGPFTAMGDLFHDLGYSVYAHDHRGFGLSGEKRGHIYSYDLFLADAAEMLSYAARQNPGRPLFLVGLSMGGHLALRLGSHLNGRVNGVVALSPGFKLRRLPSLALVGRTVFWALAQPERYIPEVPLDVVTTRNPAHAQCAAADDRYVRSYTARFYLEAVRSINRAKRELRELQAPVLMLQAGDDQLVDPVGSRLFFDRIGSSDKSFRMLPGLQHNLVVEPEMPSLVTAIDRWIAERV